MSFFKRIGKSYRLCLDNRFDPTGKNMTVRELVNKYVATKRGVKSTTRTGYKTVQNFLEKEPFDFHLVNVVVNDSVTREAITKEQINKFLKFIRDDNVY